MSRSQRPVPTSVRRSLDLGSQACAYSNRVYTGSSSRRARHQVAGQVVDDMIALVDRTMSPSEGLRQSSHRQTALPSQRGTEDAGFHPQPILVSMPTGSPGLPGSPVTALGPSLIGPFRCPSSRCVPRPRLFRGGAGAGCPDCGRVAIVRARLNACSEAGTPRPYSRTAGSPSGFVGPGRLRQRCLSERATDARMIPPAPESARS